MLPTRSLMGLWLALSSIFVFSYSLLGSFAFAENIPAVQTTTTSWQHLLPPMAAADTLDAAATYEKVFAYQHNLTNGQQQRALVSVGANLRLRRLLTDLLAGRNVSIGILGGSVSWGFYMNRGVNDWFALFNTWLQDTFPAAKVSSKNGCVPATTAEYASMCLDKFVDTANVDLVFLEYSLNDGYVDTSVRTEHAMAFERLIRKLLHLPRQPAVVLMQVLPQGIRASELPVFWWSVQDHYGVLAQYYQLPWLSMRDAMWHEVLAGQPGFTVREIYPEQEQGMQRHPSELGHKYMADAAVAMMQQIYLDMLLDPVSLSDDWSLRLMQVPEPMFTQNFESSNLLCFIGDALPPVVVASQGWSWHNDGSADKPKWGFSTNTVGAVLQIKLNTRITAQPAAATPGNGTNKANNTRQQHSSSTVVTTPTQELSPDTQSASSQSGKHTVELHFESAAAQAAVDPETPFQEHGSARKPLVLHDSPLQPALGTYHAAKHDVRHGQAAAVSSIQPLPEDAQLPVHIQQPQDAGGRNIHAGINTELQVGNEGIGSNSSSSTAGTPHLSLWQQLEPTQPRLQLLQLQQIERSADWWEAQQAQEEQQQRSKLEESNRGWQEGDVLVWVGYTKTWRGGGKALMSCLGGCKCRNITVDGHHRWKTTQSFMAKLYTQQAEDCIIQVQVLPQSSSNGTYFKVSGVMVTQRISSYDNSDFTDVLLLNAMEGEDFKLKTEG